MWFELAALLMGIAFGYLRSGKEDLITLIKQGLALGIVIGLILVILSLVSPRWESGGSQVAGAIDLSVRVILLALFFIIGVMVGDLLEAGRKQ
ncbi:MAG TPA: hypothetical protein PLU94_00330 [Methanoregulaceae archaeon]|nr:hypothetical protein [Methanoregulaceae archaeon]